MTVSNPECGLLVRPTGLPCKRWPGHLGPCIDANHITDSDPTGLFTPVAQNSTEWAYPEPATFDIESMFDSAMTQAKRLLVLVIMALVVLAFDTATAIYLLVRLPCRRFRSKSTASTASGNSRASSLRPRRRHRITRIVKGIASKRGESRAGSCIR